MTPRGVLGSGNGSSCSCIRRLFGVSEFLGVTGVGFILDRCSLYIEMQDCAVFVKFFEGLVGV